MAIIASLIGLTFLLTSLPLLCLYIKPDYDDVPSLISPEEALRRRLAEDFPDE